MRKVHLVFSAHRENGLCNADELLAILKTLEPDTIFEEITPSDFDAYYKRRLRWTLETLAVSKYAQLRMVNRVPVDRYDPPADLFSEIQEIFDCVEQASQEYLDLKEENARDTYRYGFKYLNDVICTGRMARMSDIEGEVVAETGDGRLVLGLERWRHLMHMRERAMVEVIYRYSRENCYAAGLFLVGAAHKLGIAREIAKYAPVDIGLIDWNLGR